MIVVDTSALMAVLKDEPEAAGFARALTSGQTLVAAPTKFELLLVSAAMKKSGGDTEARELLRQTETKVVGWTSDHAELAFDAFIRFGKGRHPARLNFGDCISYALAKSLDAPLLFKGGDFALTDVKVAAIGV